MRNRALHDALRDFALEAAARLTADVRAGAELSFDVVEEPGGASVLYRYQPLTSDFIDERWEALRRLPACTAAASALSGGAELYLRVHGGPASADSEPALRAMLDRLYQDATNFEFPEERFERAYAELERALYDNMLRTAIVAPVLGLELEGERVDLGDGLFLVAGDRFDAPPEAVWEPAGEAAPNVLCVLRRDIDPDAPLPLAEARRRFRSALGALRLLKAGGVALGPLAFGRVDEGGWKPLALATPGVARGGTVVLGAAEEAELVELIELVRGPGAHPVAWALGRLEMGLDRPRDTEALSDYLLALTALFAADDDAGRASLPLRLAALCADAPERKVVRRRVERAFALEARLKAGAAPGTPDGDETPRMLVLELEQCLRALLRDVVCGYLEPNLTSAADDVLVTSEEPVEIAAADLREEREPPRAPRFSGVAPEPEPPEPEPPRPERARRFSDAHPPAEVEDVRDDPAPRADGVTHSSDWDDTNEWEDDAANWSAPV